MTKKEFIEERATRRAYREDGHDYDYIDSDAALLAEILWELKKANQLWRDKEYAG